MRRFNKHHDKTQCNIASSSKDKEYIFESPLRFGDSKEFSDMLLEIRWLRSIKGRIDDEDILYLSARNIFFHNISLGQ